MYISIPIKLCLTFKNDRVTIMFLVTKKYIEDNSKIFLIISSFSNPKVWPAM